MKPGPLVRAARVLVPVSCPGCGREDVRWCEECEAPWWEEPWRAEADAGRLDIDGRATLPVWSVTVLEGPTHGAVVAWKDGGRRDLDSFFAGAAYRAGSAIAPHLQRLGRAVTVVPAPSRAASRRRRGEDLPALLATAVAKGLSQAGLDARVIRALTIGSGEQRGGSTVARWRGMRGAVRVTRQPSSHFPVLLVDDVMTSGATLAACAEALEGAGAAVVAGVVLATARRVAGDASRGLW